MSQNQYHISKIFGNTEEPLSKEKLIRYAKGEATPAEAHEVERYLIDDPFTADALEGLKMLGASRFEAALNEILEGIQTRKPQENSAAKVINFTASESAPKATPKRKNPYRQYSIAASLLILVAVGMLFFFPGEKQYGAIANDFYNIDEAALIITRNASDEQDYFMRGKSLFAENKYEEAAPLLAMDSSPEANYFAGHAYYLQTKYDSARMKFQTVLDSNNDFVQQASWFLALTYLQLDMSDQSEAQLKKIVQDPISDFAENAGKLLEEISSK